MVLLTLKMVTLVSVLVNPLYSDFDVNKIFVFLSPGLQVERFNDREKEPRSMNLRLSVRRSRSFTLLS